MPRTSARSSDSAWPLDSRASASSVSARSGFSLTICSAKPMFMPRATSRACAPSCRSRSIRRSSAADASTASQRDSVSSPTLAAISFLVGASSDDEAMARIFSSHGPAMAQAGSMPSRKTWSRNPCGAAPPHPSTTVP